MSETIGEIYLIGAKTVELTDADGVPTICRFATISTSEAKQKIDDTWWVGSSQDTVDRDWNWAALFQKYMYNPRYTNTCLESCAGEVIGAMITNTAVRSAVEDGARAVMISWLAVEPKSRFSTGTRRYKGVGRSLVYRAVIESLLLGFQGRLVVFPAVDSEEFYLKVGFEQTDVENDEGCPLFELLPRGAKMLQESFQ